MIKSGNEYVLNDRLYVIPQDPENRISILNVDRKTKEALRLKHRIYVEHDWQCNTIANAYIESIIRALGLDIKNTGNANASWNFYNLFTARATIKRNEDAEKEGNINIAFDTEKGIEDIITDTTPIEERKYNYITPEAAYSFPNNNAMTEAYKKIDTASRMELHNKYSISIPNDWVVTATGVVFFENIIRELLFMVANSSKQTASINFNDNIECHAIIKNEKNVLITLRPGMNAKLLIKSDETTELDGDDDA